MIFDRYKSVNMTEQDERINALGASLAGLRQPEQVATETPTEVVAPTGTPTETQTEVQTGEQVQDQTQEPPVQSTQTEPESDDSAYDLDKELAALRGDTKKASETPKALDLGVFKETLGKEYTSLDEVTSDIKGLKDKYEALERTLSNVPPELRNAMELAANGADYLELLNVSSINYDLIPDEEIIRNEFINVNKGVMSEAEALEKANELIQLKSPEELRMLAYPYKEAFKTNQRATVQRFQQEAISRKQKIESELQVELDKTEKLFGVKITPSDRKAALQNLSKGISGKYRNPDGSVNAKQAVMNELVTMKLEDILKTSAHKAKVETKTQMVVETSNVNLGKTNPIAPVIESSNGKSPLENYLDSLKASRG